MGKDDKNITDNENKNKKQNNSNNSSVASEEEIVDQQDSKIINSKKEVWPNSKNDKVDNEDETTNKGNDKQNIKIEQSRFCSKV